MRHPSDEHEALADDPLDEDPDRLDVGEPGGDGCMVAVCEMLKWHPTNDWVQGRARVMWSHTVPQVWKSLTGEML